ncbi:MAG: PHP domain-containing protein [Chloroflexota bacterium]
MTTLARNRVDLHCHSRRSDGALEPLALWAEMRGWGLAVASLTDHDTLQGYRELRAAGLGDGTQGPRLVPGLEINSVGGLDQGRPVEGLGRAAGELHILGYGIDPDDAALDAALARQRDGRRVRIDLTLDALRELGMPVDHEFASLALDAEASRGRPHVAEALVLAGHATDVSDAFARWLAWGRPAFVPRQGMGPRDAIDAIGAAGGIAVLAHASEAPDHPEDVRTLREWGLGGLEVHYRRFDWVTVERLRHLAERLELLPTGGSDFHGQDHDYRTVQRMTMVPEPVGEGMLAALRTRRARQGRHDHAQPAPSSTWRPRRHGHGRRSRPPTRGSRSS